MAGGVVADGLAGWLLSQKPSGVELGGNAPVAGQIAAAMIDLAKNGQGDSSQKEGKQGRQIALPGKRAPFQEARTTPAVGWVGMFGLCCWLVVRASRRERAG